MVHDSVCHRCGRHGCVLIQFLQQWSDALANDLEAMVGAIRVWSVAGLHRCRSDVDREEPLLNGFYAAQLPNPTFGKGGLLWASLTLALLTLPVVIVATEEALAAVPNSLREGSLACGASKWQTIRRIILPHARPGILTGAILAMARGAGEVAPLMLVGALPNAPECDGQRVSVLPRFTQLLCTSVTRFIRSVSRVRIAKRLNDGLHMHAAVDSDCGCTEYRCNLFANTSTSVDSLATSFKRPACIAVFAHPRQIQWLKLWQTKSPEESARNDRCWREGRRSHPRRTAQVKPAVEVQHFNLWYGKKQALHEISMSIPRGKVTALIGPAAAASRRCCERQSHERLDRWLVDSWRHPTDGESIFAPGVDVIECESGWAWCFRNPIRPDEHL